MFDISFIYYLNTLNNNRQTRGPGLEIGHFLVEMAPPGLGNLCQVFTAFWLPPMSPKSASHVTPVPSLRPMSPVCPMSPQPASHVTRLRSSF